MIKECLEVFKEAYKENPNIIIDNYIPKDGRYILVLMNEDPKDWEVISDINIIFDKKEKEVQGKNEEYYHLTKSLDYYSNLVDMRKPIDNKKTIHSSNYYSFYFKKAVFESKINEESIKRYFTILRYPEQKYKDKKSKALYQNNVKNLGEVNIEELNQIEQWILNNIRSFEINIKEKDYFKILFTYSDEQKTIEAYKREQMRYVRTNIFNKNKYNQMIDGKIYGLSNNNMGLGSKKPYLENLDRLVSLPYLITMDEAILQKYFFDYLQTLTSQKIYKLYLNTEKKTMSTTKIPNVGIELSFSFKKEVSILGYRKIVKEYKGIEILLKKIIDASFKKEEGKATKSKGLKDEDLYKYHRERYVFFDILDFVFFYKFLFNNENDLTAATIKSIEQKRMLLKYGQALLEWKNTENTTLFEKQLNNLILESVAFSIQEDYFKKAVQQMDVGLSLMEYFEQIKEGHMTNVREITKQKILSKDEYIIESDDEALYAVGQLMRYMQSLNKAGKKNMTFLQTMLHKKKNSQIVEELMKIMKRYKHLFDTDYSLSRANLLASNLFLYQFKEDHHVDFKMLMAGFLDRCYIFTKDETKEKLGGKNGKNE